MTKDTTFELSKTVSFKSIDFLISKHCLSYHISKDYINYLIKHYSFGPKDSSNLLFKVDISKIKVCINKEDIVTSMRNRIFLTINTIYYVKLKRPDQVDQIVFNLKDHKIRNKTYLKDIKLSYSPFETIELKEEIKLTNLSKHDNNVLDCVLERIIVDQIKRILQNTIEELSNTHNYNHLLVQG